MFWTPLHLHTDYTNGSGGYFEVVTKASDYIGYAVEHRIPSICFTEHGGVTNWISTKREANENGLKYIHAIECYVTMDIHGKDRYHTILIAKNYDGVKGINRLSSASFNREDGHFYYKPRITFDELSDLLTEGNVYMTTACMASGLAQGFFNNDTDLQQKWIDLLVQNDGNTFLEVQPHNNDDQKKYNQYLLYLSQEYNLPLIASNDIHALNGRHDKIRKIIKKGKSGQ